MTAWILLAIFMSFYALLGAFAIGFFLGERRQARKDFTLLHEQSQRSVLAWRKAERALREGGHVVVESGDRQ